VTGLCPSCSVRPISPSPGESSRQTLLRVLPSADDHAIGHGRVLRAELAVRGATWRLRLTCIMPSPPTAALWPTSPSSTCPKLGLPRPRRDRRSSPGARLSVTARKERAVTEAIGEAAWSTIRYPNAVFGADLADRVSGCACVSGECRSFSGPRAAGGASPSLVSAIAVRCCASWRRRSGCRRCRWAHQGRTVRVWPGSTHKQAACSVRAYSSLSRSASRRPRPSLSTSM
jgi:hypothetical protein